MKKSVDIINKIHSSPFKLTIVSSGGGTNAISALLKVPGASNPVKRVHEWFVEAKLPPHN